MLQVTKKEIDILDEFIDIGWIRLDLRPIKHVLSGYAAKWLWVISDYLSGRVCQSFSVHVFCFAWPF